MTWLGVYRKKLSALLENCWIGFTDITRYKNTERTDIIVGNWLRNRSTIDLLGIWEQLNNPSFKLVEFDEFRK